MGDVLAKLGVFDLIAVLLSGFSALTISILLLTMTCAVEIDEAKFHFMGLEALPALAMSYLFGLALQEIGSFLERIIYHGGRNARIPFRGKGRRKRNIAMCNQRYFSCVRRPIGNASAAF